MSSRLLILMVVALPVAAQAAELLTIDAGSRVVIVVAPAAGKWEKKAGDDLAHYIGRMTGAKPTVAADDSARLDKLPVPPHLIYVGAAALQADPTLAQALTKVAKKDPVLRADAIILRRTGNRLFLAGTNDDSHYYAAAELLRRWGCRWYLPTAFGECVPAVKTLTVGDLDYAYAPPFEVRNYWIAWNGATDGQEEFTRRNFMNYGVGVPSGHAIGEYVQELIPKGKSVFNIPIAEDATADHIAKKVAPKFAKGEYFSLGMEDGVYHSESKLDKELQAGLKDKYFLAASLTDPFLTLYNKVSDRLLKQYPESKSKIGFLAYGNLTIPPQRKMTAAKPLVAYLAPIDIDPNHGMDDPRSPPRQEYRDILYRWAEVMQGRVVIYDYDQGMLVWRDVPNPSIQSIRQDVKHYRKAGILGISTESRNAIATTFLNLFIRGQLYWNPDADVDALVAEFYERFYGPAARPMAAYWNAIFQAWAETIVTEHEHFVIPAIYTPGLMAKLRTHLADAEKLSGTDKLIAERLKFTRLGFEVLDAYTAMVKAAATDVDYKAAVAAGVRGLKARLELAKMNPTFTTHVVGVAAETDMGGPAWWPGEVQQYRDLAAYTDGTKGTLVAKLPLEWSLRRDPHDTGIVSGWAYKPLAKNDWQPIRTDLYMQAQPAGMEPDHHGYTGNAWYRTDLDLPADAAKRPLHLRFPGLFNECWLYVNGHLVAHREYKEPWWLTDYKFEWDVDLAGHVQEGTNTIAVRVYNPHHFGGMFRRPFVYRAR